MEDVEKKGMEGGREGGREGRKKREGGKMEGREGRKEREGGMRRRVESTRKEKRRGEECGLSDRNVGKGGRREGKINDAPA